MNAGRFLTAALREGLEVRQSELAFTHESAGEFPSGSLILTRADNPDGLQTKLQSSLRRQAQPLKVLIQAG